MAHSQDHEKRISELIAAAGNSRSALTSYSTNLRNALDFCGKFENAVRSHPSIWVGAATAVGWFISQIPARRKKVYVTVPETSKGTAKIASKPTRAPKKGLILAATGLAFQFLRPTLQRLVTEQVNEWTDKLRHRKKR
ncbi:MAG TPA: hypothetical protein VIT91_05125 [Chthoniobacterales bacterium]